MTINQFIEAAIEGGWISHNTFNKDVKYVVWSDPVRVGISYVRWDLFPADPMEPRLIRHSDMVLDPEAWKAVGKVKGWEGKVEIIEEWKHGFELKETKYVKVGVVLDWQDKMLSMVKELCEGKTLEAYISTL